MVSSSLRHKIAVLLLGVVLAAPLVSAAAPQAQPAPHTAGGLGALLSSLWSTLNSLWGDNGCSLDPYGRCAGASGSAASSGATLDAGCTIDPFGWCASGH
jgi:hypothetical protein